MFERFTHDARGAVAQAQEHARRLGHHYIGCEHLLLAVASADAPASAAVTGHSVTRRMACFYCAKEMVFS